MKKLLITLLTSLVFVAGCKETPEEQALRELAVERAKARLISEESRELKEDPLCLFSANEDCTPVSDDPLRIFPQEGEPSELSEEERFSARSEGEMQPQYVYELITDESKTEEGWGILKPLGLFSSEEACEIHSQKNEAQDQSKSGEFRCKEIELDQYYPD